MGKAAKVALTPQETEALEEIVSSPQSDLDFGIYRIISQKRDEIERFLHHDLLPQVRKAFEAYQGGDRAHVEDELKEAVKQAESLGVDPRPARRSTSSGQHWRRRRPLDDYEKEVVRARLLV